MKLDEMLHPQREITHRMHCACSICRPPAPSDMHGVFLLRLRYRAPALFAAGMATGAVAMAATGHLGAALRALIGL